MFMGSPRGTGVLPDNAYCAAQVTVTASTLRHNHERMVRTGDVHKTSFHSDKLPGRQLLTSLYLIQSNLSPSPDPENTAHTPLSPGPRPARSLGRCQGMSSR